MVSYEKMVSLFGDDPTLRFFVAPINTISGNPITVGGVACPNENSFCTYDEEYLYIGCRGTSAVGVEVKA